MKETKDLAIPEAVEADDSKTRLVCSEICTDTFDDGCAKTMDDSRTMCANALVLLRRLTERKYDLKGSGATLTLMDNKLETKNTETFDKTNLKPVRKKRCVPGLKTSKRKAKPITKSVSTPRGTHGAGTGEYSTKNTSTGPTPRGTRGASTGEYSIKNTATGSTPRGTHGTGTREYSIKHTSMGPTPRGTHGAGTGEYSIKNTSTGSTSHGTRGTGEYSINNTATGLIVLNNKNKRQGASRLYKAPATDDHTERNSEVNPKRHLPWIRSESFKGRHSRCQSTGQLMFESPSKSPKVIRKRPSSFHIGTLLHDARSSVNPQRHRHCVPETETQSTSPRSPMYSTSKQFLERTAYHSPYL